MNKPARIILTAVVASVCIAAAYEPATCKTRKTNTAAGINVVHACNNNPCPSNVDTVGKIVMPPQLKIDGWFIYIRGGKVYKSSIKNFNPRQIGGFASAERIEIWGNGDWIMVFGDGDVWLMDSDGNKKTATGLNKHGNAKNARYLKASPVGSEIVAQFGGNPPYTKAYKIDFSSGTPAKGAERIIGEWIPWVSTRDVDYCGSYIFARSQALGYSARLMTIPNNGMGMANGYKCSKDPGCTSYDVHAQNVCGNALSQSGLYHAANNRAPYDCIPDNHKGIVVLKNKHYKEPLISYTQWVFEEPESKVLWCPKTYTEGGKTYNLRNGLWDQNEFHHYSFANTDDYIIGVHQRNPPYNCWLINWKTGEWTPLMPDQGGSSAAGDHGGCYMPDVFITHINGVPVDEAVNSISPAFKTPAPRHMKTGLRGEKAAMLNAWVDLLGRSTRASRKLDTSRKIYIEKSGERKIYID